LFPMTEHSLNHCLKIGVHFSYACQSSHCGKPNARTIISQSDSYLRWKERLQRLVQNFRL